MMNVDTIKHSEIIEKTFNLPESDQTKKILLNHNNQRHQRSIFGC